MNKYGSLAVFCLAFFFLFTQNAFATTININTIADAYVREGLPNNNYGSSSPVWTQTQSNNNIYGFFMFNKSEIPSNATISSAQFFIRLQTAGYANTSLAYNTSLTWNETNITWNAKPAQGTLQDNKTIAASIGWKTFNVTDAVRSSYTQNSNISLMVRYDKINSTTAYSNPYYSRESAYIPYLEINFTMNNNCNTTIIGTYCDPSDLAVNGHTRGIVTTPDYTCNNDKYYTCPEGSLCTQITPQVNITTPLVENFTDCSKCYYTYTSVVGLFPILLKTNCPNNPECNPGIANISGIYYSNCLTGSQSPLLYTCPGVFITPADSIPASADYYTAGCFDPSLGWVPIVINSTGGQTTINDLTIEIFGEGTNLTTPTISNCPNSTTSCYVLTNGVCTPALCVPTTAPATTACTAASGYTDQLVCAMGGMLGVSDIGNSKFIASIMFSFIIAIAVLAALNYYDVGGESMGMVFVMSLLMLTIMFTFIGWFPAWIMIILMVLGALMVAKMLKVV